MFSPSWQDAALDFLQDRPARLQPVSNISRKYRHANTAMDAPDKFQEMATAPFAKIVKTFRGKEPVS